MGKIEIEIWKDVIGYEGYYSVSNKGRIKSHTNYILSGRGNSPKERKGKILKIKINSMGHGFVKLGYKDCAKKYYLVHRLVAFSFIDTIEGKNLINHKNGIKIDNRVENLEWCTQSENMYHNSYILKKGIRNKPILKIYNGEVIKTYTGINHIQKTEGKKIKSVVHAYLKGKSKSTRTGYDWKYEKND